MTPRPIISPRAPVMLQHLGGLLRGIDVAIGQHGARQRGDGARDELVVHLAPIHLLHRARVHGEQVERVLREDGQQLGEDLRRVEADAGLDREPDLHRVAQRAQDGIHARGVAQQAAARAFAIDDRRGTAQVQIHRRHRVLLQLARRAHQRGNVVADHLRDDRPAGGVLGDGLEDVLVQPRSGIDPEVLRDSRDPPRRSRP